MEDTMVRKGTLVAALLAVGTACSDAQSGDVLTSGMYASLSVTAKGDGTSVAEAVLKVGGANSTTFVYLTDGDELLASFGDADPVPMTEISLGDYHSYGATLETDDPTEVFNIAFVRTVDEGAPSSTMQLPEPFGMISPPTTASRAEDLVLSFDLSPSVATVTVTVEGDCVQLYSANAQGDGTVTIPADAIQTGEGNEAATCPVTVTIRKFRPGTPDPAFEEGGIANGIQSRSFEMQSTP
jgi:hypothetical protein